MDLWHKSTWPRDVEPVNAAKPTRPLRIKHICNADIAFMTWTNHQSVLNVALVWYSCGTVAVALSHCHNIGLFARSTLCHGTVIAFIQHSFCTQLYVYDSKSTPPSCSASSSHDPEAPLPSFKSLVSARETWSNGVSKITKIQTGLQKCRRYQAKRDNFFWKWIETNQQILRINNICQNNYI